MQQFWLTVKRRQAWPLSNLLDTDFASEKQLTDFAHTKRKGKPEHVKKWAKRPSNA